MNISRVSLYKIIVLILLFNLYLPYSEGQILGGCGDGCPLCLAGICLITAPINIALGIVKTITSKLEIQVDLNLLGILTVENDLLCDAKINLLGGVLVVDGLITLTENCVIVVQNEATIQVTSGSKTILKDVTLTFLPSNVTGVSTKLTMSGDFDMVFKMINGTEAPRFNLIDTKNVNFTKSALAIGSIAPINQVTINYGNNYQSLSISQIIIQTLEIFNSIANTISIPNAGIQRLLLRYVKATGINESKNLIDLLNSTLEITNTFATTAVSTVGSIINLASPLSIATVASNGTSWNLNSNLSILSTHQFTTSIITVKSPNLSLFGIGSFLQSPLKFLNSTIQQTLAIGSNAIINLVNDLAPSDIIQGTLGQLSLTNGGQLNFGSLSSSPSSLIYSLGSTQILANNGTIKSLGSLQIAGQLNPIEKLNLALKNLVVASNNLELKGGSLNILNSIQYLTKGTLKLADNILMNIGKVQTQVGDFSDQIFDNVDATLSDVILALDNLVLPNRLRVNPNSTIKVSNLTLQNDPQMDLLDLIDFVLIISDVDQILCNGSPQTPQSIASHSQYQFVCDERLISLRVTNCTGVTCNDGRCVSDIGLCSNPNGTCSVGLVKCWNSDCASSIENCKPLPECGSKSLRCLDGCHPFSSDNTTSCPTNCTEPTCIDPLTPYFGCGFGSFQCPNGGCVSELSKCCTLGSGNCHLSPLLNRPTLSYTNVDSNKNMMLPIIYSDNTLNGLDVYGYIQIPNDFYTSTYSNKLQVNKLTDSYLSTIDGSFIWGNQSNYRDSIVSLAFDLTLESLVTPVFDKPIQFELKVPNLAQYNLTDICLYFINVSTNSWQCMNESTLSISDQGFLVGSTNHFTSFAVLLQSYSNDDDDEGGGNNNNTSGKDNTSGNNNNNNDGEGNGSSSISRKTLIILVASICGGVVVISAVAGFFIHTTLKHGGVKYWWTMKKEKTTMV